MKSHRLIPILSIIMSCISVTLYSSEVANVSGVSDDKKAIVAPTNEVYKALQENNVQKAIRVLTNIKKREKFGFIYAALADAGLLKRGIRLGIGGVATGLGAGHLFNCAQPISQPVRPEPISANTVTNHAISVAAGVAGVGAGAAAGAGVATAGVTISSWIAAEAVGTAVGAPGVATVVTAVTALGGVVGGLGGCTAAHAVQHTNAEAHNARAMAAYDHQVAQTQSQAQGRVNSALLAGAAGATLVIIGPSARHIACIPGSMHECCQYKHKGHNLWSIAFEMDDNNLMTFSTKFLEYTPARDLMNEPMQNGMYPIHAAIRRGNHDLVELLVRRNIIITETNSTVTIRSCYSLDQQDGEGNTALIYAIGEGNREIATTLLTPHEKTSHCAKITAPNAAGLTPLHISAQKGYADCAEHLLRLDESDIDADHKREHDIALVNMQDKKGNTPLLHAAHHGHYSVVETLLDRPNKTGAADPFLANKEGLTPLMAACRIGHERIVEKLLSLITPDSIQKKDATEKNALHYLLEGRSRTMFSIGSTLLSKGIDIDDMAIALIEDLGSDREDMQNFILGINK